MPQPVFEPSPLCSPGDGRGTGPRPRSWIRVHCQPREPAVAAQSRRFLQRRPVGPGTPRESRALSPVADDLVGGVSGPGDADLPGLQSRLRRRLRGLRVRRADGTGSRDAWRPLRPGVLFQHPDVRHDWLRPDRAQRLRGQPDRDRRSAGRPHVSGPRHGPALCAVCASDGIDSLQPLDGGRSVQRRPRADVPHREPSS